MAITINGTWATVADVFTLTGQTVTEAQVVIAQSLIEGQLGRVWRDSDAGTGDEYWLARAVCWQAVYVKANPHLATQVDVEELDQDGFRVKFRDDNRSLWMAPAALSALNNLRTGGNQTLRMATQFQRLGRRTARHARHSGVYRQAGWRQM